MEGWKELDGRSWMKGLDELDGGMGGIGWRDGMNWMEEWEELDRVMGGII